MCIRDSSYTGEALDYKTPLLKALGAVDKAATEVCRMFDPNVKRVFANLLQSSIPTHTVVSRNIQLH